MSARRYPDWAAFEFPPTSSRAVPVAFCADLGPDSVLGACRRGIVPLPAADEYFRTLNEVRYADLVAAGTVAMVGRDGADGAVNDPYWAAWWSPDPRPVIGPGEVHLSRHVRRRLRRDGFCTTANADFGRVAEECRAGREPRWLTDQLLASLTELHAAGWAHSIEVWLGDDLVGGAMGIGIGSLISGDSLFGRYPGAAAVAVADMGARLAAAGGTVIDAQWDGPLLRSLGAALIPRQRYLELLAESLASRPTEPMLLGGERQSAGRLLD